jgi:hypothetical protein
VSAEARPSGSGPWRRRGTPPRRTIVHPARSSPKAAAAPGAPPQAASTPAPASTLLAWWRRPWALLLSTAFHLLLLWLLVWLVRTPQPEARERAEPIPVSLIEEAPERDVPPEILRFGAPSHPRVRDTQVAARLRALAPPPPQVPLSPEAASGGPAIPVFPGGLAGFEAGGAGGGIAFTGVGGGNASGGIGSFQEYVGGLRQAGLDVVFVIDATGSMGWLIADVKDRVRALADWIRDLVPVTRFGVVAYRDDDDPEFLVRVQPLTLRIDRVHDFLDRLEARGGGDTPEGVVAGIEAAIARTGFRADSRRVILVVGDAPPHPEEMQKGLAAAREFARTGGTLSVLDVSYDANPQLVAARLGKRVEELTLVQPRGVMPELREFAGAGAGDAATLSGDQRVVRQLAVLIFGQSWEADVRPMLGDL